MSKPVQSKQDRAGNKAHQQDSSGAWCKFQTVLDVKVKYWIKGRPLMEPPMLFYFEECMLGVRHGPGDDSVSRPTSPAESSRSPSKAFGVVQAPSASPQGPAGKRDPSDSQASWVSAKLSVPPRVQVQMLADALKSDAAMNTGKALFWLCLGGVFGCFADDVASHLRKELGRSWHLMCLEVEASSRGNRGVIDFVLSRAPYVFAQTIYRLLHDGFDEDKKHFMMHAGKLIQKLTLVVHFEMTGFQLTPDSVKKGRRKLFLPRVLMNPHVNQRDFLKGQMRQTVLESQKDSKPRIMEFGRIDAPPMDEIQLEHLMTGRLLEILKRLPAAPKANGRHQLGVNSPGKLGEDLSVDRYQHLTGLGAELASKHFSTLGILASDGSVSSGVSDSEEARSSEPSDSEEFGSEPNNEDASNRQSVSRLLSNWSSKAGAKEGQEDSFSEDPDSSRPGTSPQATKRPQTSDENGVPLLDSDAMKRRRQTKVQKKPTFCAEQMMQNKEKEREQREQDKKARRLKQGQLQEKLQHEPLPAELCVRAFCTTWVSPPMQQNMTQEPDRNVLRKTKVDTFNVRMETPSISAQELKLARPSSMPDLKGTAAQSRAASKTSLEDNPSRSPKGPTGELGSSMNESTNRLPQVKNENKQHAVTMDTAGRINSKVVVERLDKQATSFRKKSFAMYLKEYDVFTGYLKMRFDEKRLRDEEDAFLRKLDKLVGGKPRRLHMPDGGVSRRPESTKGRGHGFPSLGATI